MPVYLSQTPTHPLINKSHLIGFHPARPPSIITLMFTGKSEHIYSGYPVEIEYLSSLIGGVHFPPITPLMLPTNPDVILRNSRVFYK